MRLGMLVRAAGGALEAVALACRSAALLFLAAIAVLVVGQVVGRNAFDLGMPWADEFARFSGIAVVFLCVPLLALRGRHVVIDVLPTLLPPRLRAIVVAASEVAVLAFCVLTLIGFHSFLSRAGKFATPAIGIPNWLFYAPALAGFVLLLCVAALRLAGAFAGDRPAAAADDQAP